VKGRKTPETLRIAAAHHKKRGTARSYKVARDLEKQARLLEKMKS